MPGWTKLLLRVGLWLAMLADLAFVGLLLAVQRFDATDRTLSTSGWITGLILLPGIVGTVAFLLRPSRNRMPHLVAGIALLAFAPLSIRSVNVENMSAPTTISAQWTLVDESQWMQVLHTEHYCYRADFWWFELHGNQRGRVFRYWRGIWPARFSEQELAEVTGFGRRCGTRDLNFAGVIAP